MNDRISSLKALFPEISDNIIESVSLELKEDFDACVDALLEIASGQNGERNAESMFAMSISANTQEQEWKSHSNLSETPLSGDWDSCAIEYLNDTVPFTSNAVLSHVLRTTDDPFKAEQLGRRLYLSEDLQSALEGYDNASEYTKSLLKTTIEAASILHEHDIGEIYRSILSSKNFRLEEVIEGFLGRDCPNSERKIDTHFKLSDWNKKETALGLFRAETSQVAHAGGNKATLVSSFTHGSGRNDDQVGSAAGETLEGMTGTKTGSEDEQFALAQTFFGMAASAYQRGDGKRAKELSNKGREHHNRAKELRSINADGIFAATNLRQAPDTLDFHGLHVKEALEILDREVAKRHGILKLIVGKGLHSEGGRRRLCPEVKSWLRRKGLSFDENPVGTLNVRL